MDIHSQDIRSPGTHTTTRHRQRGELSNKRMSGELRARNVPALPATSLATPGCRTAPIMPQALTPWADARHRMFVRQRFSRHSRSLDRIVRGTKDANRSTTLRPMAEGGADDAPGIDPLGGRTVKRHQKTLGTGSQKWH